MRHVIAVLLFTAVMSLSASTDLIRFVPGDVQGMAWIDMAQGWRHPLFQRFRNNDQGLDQQCRLLETKLAQFRLRPEDAIKNMAVFYNRNSVGSVFYTPILEPQFDKMLAGGITKGAEHTIQVKKVNGNGYRYYLVRSMFKGKQLPDSGFTYVGTNQVMMAPVAQLDAIRRSLSQGSIASNKQYQAQLRLINTNAPLWTVFRVPQEVSNAIAASSAGNPAAAFLANVSNGAFSVDPSGSSKRDFLVSGFLTCRDVAVAQKMAQQLQFLPMACDNTSSAMKVSESMNIKAKGNTVFVRMILPESMQKMLMGGMYQPQAAAPATAVRRTATTPSRPAATSTRSRNTARYK